uniref:Uncharacterized protein LOC114329612 n=1 Tax=Diabrotica virgifera virgifera TaxID=50390 RepID=A0A6P7FEX1_DIAVI
MTLNLWNEKWKTSTSKLRDVKEDTSPWNPHTINRSNQVILSRLRLGHCKLTHEHLITHTEAPKCRRCNIPVSVKHVLTECDEFAAYKQSISGYSNNMKDILNLQTDCKPLFQFFNKCNLASKI